MKDPYGKILDTYLGKLNEIGLHKLSDDEYVTVFSDGSCSVEIVVERYYMPSITTKFVDYEGNKYSMRVIREILDLENLKSDSIKLEDIKRKYRLDDDKADDFLHRKGVDEYVSLSFEQLLGFLLTSLDKLRKVDESFRYEYSKKEEGLMGRLGL